MTREYPEWGNEIHRMPTGNLVIALQKLAKNGSYFKPYYRGKLLTEAARRLQAYRAKELRGVLIDPDDPDNELDSFAKDDPRSPYDTGRCE
jgi:hypothetical protein